MDKTKAIDNLIKRMAIIHRSTKEPLNNNIYRGHSRSISVEVEDSIALLLSELLPENYSFILDPSIYVNGRNNRPDLLILDGKNDVVAMVEIKANMGWCRNASSVLNEIVFNDKQFKQTNKLWCELSNGDNREITYGDGVKLFLVSLTDKNCAESRHKANRTYADSVGVKYCLLFSGWYGDLTVRDVEQFADSILSLARP